MKATAITAASSKRIAVALYKTEQVLVPTSKDLDKKSYCAACSSMFTTTPPFSYIELKNETPWLLVRK
jgi:hypothetical protein